MGPADFKKIVVMVMYDGTVQRDVEVKQMRTFQTLHEANFVVIERPRDGAMVVWKERFIHDLRDRVVTRSELERHVDRHVAAVKKCNSRWN